MPARFVAQGARKSQISCANLSARTLLVSRDRVVGALLNCPAESKPNSRITKRKMIGVMLIVFSISDKKSPRRGRRAEHQSMDSIRQTRRKRASRSLGRLHLSSSYFLKRSKIDISQNMKLFWDARVAVGKIWIDGGCKIPGTK